jgi:glyoxylase-like metal-dependent hydrolase (beta-lactamase superfamily II)
VGRDDLPGGDPQSHFYSVQALKKVVRPSSILLPGHDHKGGRADLWESQLVTNPSLSQDFEDFVRESAAFVAPAPKQFKEALVENMK